MCGGLLLAGCADRPARPYTMTYTPPVPLISGDADRNASLWPAPANIPTQVGNASVYVPVWKAVVGDVSNDAATAAMTVGGIEAMQRLKDARAEREAERLAAIDAAQAARTATKLPAPELPAPAAEGAAGAAAERKLAGNLITRDGAAVAAGAAERRAAGSLLTREGAAVAERAAVRAAERSGAGLLMRGAVVRAGEGEGLGMLLRWILFL
jgi:hypothetical protein